MSGYTIINLQSDSVAWAKSVGVALTSTKPKEANVRTPGLTVHLLV